MSGQQGEVMGAPDRRKARLGGVVRGQVAHGSAGRIFPSWSQPWLS